MEITTQKDWIRDFLNTRIYALSGNEENLRELDALDPETASIEDIISIVGEKYAARFKRKCGECGDQVSSIMAIESSADTAGVAPRHATDGIPPLSAALCYPLAEFTQNTLP